MNGTLLGVGRRAGTACRRRPGTRWDQRSAQLQNLQRARSIISRNYSAAPAVPFQIATDVRDDQPFRLDPLPLPKSASYEQKENNADEDVSLLRLIRQSDMSAQAMARLIAERRSLDQNAKRSNTYEEVFDFLSTNEKVEIRSLVDQIVLHNRDRWLSLVWTSWVNALAHCRDWDEVMEELQIASGHRPSASDQDAFVNNTIWPATVLQRALERIQTRAQLEEAAKLVKLLLPGMRLRLARQTLRRLDFAVHVQHKAKYLSASMTDMVLDVAQRCLGLETNAVNMVLQVPDAAYASYSVLRRHVHRLMVVSDSRTQRQAMRVVEWAVPRLNIDLVDRLRMQVLRLIPTGESLIADDAPVVESPWRTARWIMSTSQPFANASMAQELLQELFRNGRSGVGFTFALRKAMRIAARETNAYHASKLVTCIQDCFLDRSRVHLPSLLSVDLLELLSLHNSEREAWDLFQHILKEGAQEMTHRDWNVLVGWAARHQAVPVDQVLELAQIGQNTDGSSLIHKPAMPHSEETPSSKKDRSRLLTILMSSLIKRGDQEGLDGVLKVWQHIERSEVLISGACLAHYCRALTLLKRSDQATVLLENLTGISIVKRPDGPLQADEQRSSTIPNVEPDEEMFHLLMLTMIGQAQPNKAFELFKAMKALRTILLSCRTLELLQRAAFDASQLHYNDDAAHPLLSSLFSRLRQGMSHQQIENVTKWDGEPAAVVARNVVRDCLFQYRPDLLNARNPLDTIEKGDGLLWRNEVRAHNAGTWIHEHFRVFSPFALSTPDRSNAVDRGSSDDKEMVVSTNDNQHLMHFVFSPWLFHQYLQLLPFVAKSAEARTIGEQALWDERFLVLAWMRALDVRPLPQTLCLICTYLDEVLPPAADSGQHADAHHATGPLSAYLTEWLGEDALPTFEDVLRYVKEDDMSHR